MHMGACAKAACCRHTPLTWAARDGRKEVVQVLLEHKAEIEAKDQDGYQGPKEGDRKSVV